MLTTCESLDDGDVDEEGVMVEDWKGDPLPGCQKGWREKVKNLETKQIVAKSTHMDQDLCPHAFLLFCNDIVQCLNMRGNSFLK